MMVRVLPKFAITVLIFCHPNECDGPNDNIGLFGPEGLTLLEDIQAIVREELAETLTSKEIARRRFLERVQGIVREELSLVLGS